MSNYFFLSIYWPSRPLTLRQYADETRQYLLLLGSIHPAFRSLEWVGNRPDSAVKLLPDLGNLDELLYRNAGSKESFRYNDANPDGSPSWNSMCDFGYGMQYDTGRSVKVGGLSISLSAGRRSVRMPNSATISFPPPDDEQFPHREFFDHDFLRHLFSQVAAFWKPARGLLTSHAFSRAVVGDEMPGVGWLTYIGDPRATALRHDSSLKSLMFEEMPDGGLLISLDRTIISPANTLQVEKARLLRSKLVAEKFIDV